MQCKSGRETHDFQVSYGVVGNVRHGTDRNDRTGQGQTVCNSVVPAHDAYQSVCVRYRGGLCDNSSKSGPFPSNSSVNFQGFFKGKTTFSTYTVRERTALLEIRAEIVEEIAADHSSLEEIEGKLPGLKIRTCLRLVCHLTYHTNVRF